jgi:hypothetical protein
MERDISPTFFNNIILGCLNMGEHPQSNVHTENDDKAPGAWYLIFRKSQVGPSWIMW